MIVANSIGESRKALSKVRNSAQKISLVPTMGSLHEGHLSLLRAAREESDYVVCSIFINPTQFNDPKDFEKYPRTFKADHSKLLEHGCDLVFAPPVQEMYTGRELVRINFGEAANILEGKFRPGHFNGVAVVVAKLFNIIQPDVAFFGEKDLQQLFLIKRLTDDLSFQMEIISVPTVRNKDGLALSSRNNHLSSSNLASAATLFHSLKSARDEILKGATLKEAKFEATEMIKKAGLKLEYFEAVELKNFTILDRIDKAENMAFCVAVFAGETRLIDNIVID